MRGAVIENTEANVQPELVRAHLEQVLASPQFAGAPKLAKFLTFVVDTALAGLADQIKESLIAVEVYGRPPDYNPQLDSTVRVEAGRLRARLRDYYLSAGSTQPVTIELPKGRYVPLFRAHSPVGADDLGSPLGNPDVSSGGHPPRSLSRFSAPAARFLVFAVLFGATLAAAILFHGFRRAGHREARQTPASPETARLYLRGYEMLRRPIFKEGQMASVPPSVMESVRLFEEVTRAEPLFARGWVGLAEANEWLYEIDRNRPPERLIAAKAAARQAVELDPALPEAWTVLTSVLLYREWDMPAAESACRRALSLNPRDLLARQRYIDLLRLRGRVKDAFHQADQGMSLDPSAPGLRNRKALLLLEAGQSEEALREATTAESLNPSRKQGEYTRSLWIQAMAHQRLGRLETAEALFRRAIAHQPDDLWSEQSLGYLLAITGRTAEARDVLNSLRRQLALGRPRHSAIALVSLGLGQQDEAMRWLERGFTDRDGATLFVPLDWRFEPLESDARYEALRAQIRRTADPGVLATALRPLAFLRR